MFKEEPLTLLFTSVLLWLLGRLIQRSINRAKFSHVFIYIYGKWQIISGLWWLIKCAYSFGTCYEVQKKKSNWIFCGHTFRLQTMNCWVLAMSFTAISSSILLWFKTVHFKLSTSMIWGQSGVSTVWLPSR